MSINNERAFPPDYGWRKRPVPEKTDREILIDRAYRNYAAKVQPTSDVLSWDQYRNRRNRLRWQQKYSRLVVPEHDKLGDA